MGESAVPLGPESAEGPIVRFPGCCTDARRVMAGRDLAILSSHPRVETLPLALIEAMDAGIPVVSASFSTERMVEATEGLVLGAAG